MTSSRGERGPLEIIIMTSRVQLEAVTAEGHPTREASHGEGSPSGALRTASDHLHPPPQRKAHNVLPRPRTSLNHPNRLHQPQPLPTPRPQPLNDRLPQTARHGLRLGEKQHQHPLLRRQARPATEGASSTSRPALRAELSSQSAGRRVLGARRVDHGQGSGTDACSLLPPAPFALSGFQLLHHSLRYIYTTHLFLLHYYSCCHYGEDLPSRKILTIPARRNPNQVLLPLLQGTLWTLALQGWRFWNRSAKFSGANVGSRIRRWWWGVNNWDIPAEGNARTAAAGMSQTERFADEVGEVSFFFLVLIVFGGTWWRVCVGHGLMRLSSIIRASFRIRVGIDEYWGLCMWKRLGYLLGLVGIGGVCWSMGLVVLV